MHFPISLESMHLASRMLSGMHASGIEACTSTCACCATQVDRRKAPPLLLMQERSAAVSAIVCGSIVALWLVWRRHRRSSDVIEVGWRRATVEADVELRDRVRRQTGTGAREPTGACEPKGADHLDAAPAKEHADASCGVRRLSRPVPAAFSAVKPSFRLLEARSHPVEGGEPDWTRMRETAAAVLEAGQLWRDASFPHGPASVGTDVGGGVRWLSLEDIHGRPHVWPDGRSSYLYKYGSHAAELGDAAPPGEGVQGGLGDCYFLSALAVAVRRREVRCDLIDEALEAAGVYGVSFFVQGRWRMVWVDSFFPCRSTVGASGEPSWEPIFARSSREREAWLMIVEKAFAKLNGCFAALEGGTVAWALTLLTGGVAVTELLQGEDGTPALATGVLWGRLTRALSTGFVGAGTPPAIEVGGEPGGTESSDSASLSTAGGLVPGHAYAVLQATETAAGRRVQLRNPWGGAGLRGADFWLSIDEFALRFAMLVRCRVLRTTLLGGEWELAVLRSAWAAGSAGGCPNFGTFGSNPQLTVVPVHRRPTRLVVVLTQLAQQLAPAAAPRRSRADEHAIGLLLLRSGQVVRASKFLRSTHVVLEATLPESADACTVVPCTFEPGVHAPFVVCVYSSDAIDVRPRHGDWAVQSTEHAHRGGGLVVSRRSHCQNKVPRPVAPPPSLLRRLSAASIFCRAPVDQPPPPALARPARARSCGRVSPGSKSDDDCAGGEDGGEGCTRGGDSEEGAPKRPSLLRHAHSDWTGSSTRA